MHLLKVAKFLEVIKEIELASGRTNNQAQVSNIECMAHFDECEIIPYNVRLTYICHDKNLFGRWHARLFRREESASMDVEFSETEGNLEDFKSIVVEWIKGNTRFNRSSFNKEERAAAGVPSRNTTVEEK